MLPGAGVAELLDATADLLGRADLARLLEDVLCDELVAVGEPGEASRRLGLGGRVLLETWGMADVGLSDTTCGVWHTGRAHLP